MIIILIGVIGLIIALLEIRRIRKDRQSSDRIIARLHKIGNPTA